MKCWHSIFLSFVIKDFKVIYLLPDFIQSNTISGSNKLMISARRILVKIYSNIAVRFLFAQYCGKYLEWVPLVLSDMRVEALILAFVHWDPLLRADESWHYKEYMIRFTACEGGTHLKTQRLRLIIHILFCRQNDKTIVSSPFLVIDEWLFQLLISCSYYLMK